MIPDPAEQATMKLDDVGEALCISQSSVYAAARAGQLPVIRIGRRLLVPTAAIRRLLCLDDGPDESA